MDLATAKALRITYLHAFDSFATDPIAVGDLPAIGNPRFARECLGVLTNAGLLVQDTVNGGDDVWQAIETYDTISRGEAEQTIDAWLSMQGVEAPNPGPATPTTVPTRRERPAPANPADLPLCLCGCGNPVGRKSNYKPGHDARHAGAVARYIAESGDWTALGSLPSQALQDKATRMVEKIVEKSVSKAKPATADVPITEIVAEVNAEFTAEQQATSEPEVEEAPAPKPAPRKRPTTKSKAARNAEAALAKREAAQSK